MFFSYTQYILIIYEQKTKVKTKKLRLNKRNFYNYINYSKARRYYNSKDSRSDNTDPARSDNYC